MGCKREHVCSRVDEHLAREALPLQQDSANGRMLDAKLDPYSSALAFDGWERRWKFTLPPGYAPLPVSPAKTALLDRRWRTHGLVDPWERPGPLW